MINDNHNKLLHTQAPHWAFFIALNLFIGIM